MILQEKKAFVHPMNTDLRLEVIVADLLSEDVSLNDITMESNGLFKRNYHHDVEDMSEIMYGDGKSQWKITVNREGIYDLLPEDLFHQPGDMNNTNKDEVIQEIREQREVEKQTRLFFQPVEQEFFRQRIRLEYESRKFAHETTHALHVDIFNDLWTLPEQLDDLQKSKIGLLMPLVHKMVGKNRLLEFIFENITGDRVEIQTRLPGKFQLTGTSMLGESRLGTDFSPGGYADIMEPAEDIKIYLRETGRLSEYLPGGKAIKIFEFLTELFFPLESEPVFKIIPPAAEAEFIINGENGFQARLNYTTIL